MNRNIAITVSGQAGTGKTTVINELIPCLRQFGAVEVINEFETEKYWPDHDLELHDRRKAGIMDRLAVQVRERHGERVPPRLEQHILLQSMLRDTLQKAYAHLTLTEQEEVSPWNHKEIQDILARSLQELNKL